MIFRPYHHFESGCAGYVFDCGTIGMCAAVDIRQEDVEILEFNRGGLTRATR